MDLKLTARHEHLDDSVRQYAERKLSKLERRLNPLTLVEVTFFREHNPSSAADHTVDAVIHAKGPSIVAHEAASSYEAALDRLVDKLERQVERYRDKRTLEKRRRSSPPHQGPPAEPADSTDEPAA
jgi:putative sigma-54 modulation protein